VGAGSARTVRLLRAGLAGLVVAILCVSCAGSVPPGASCTASSECETGLACLYPLGAGCSAAGQCAIPANDCSGGIPGLVACGCGGALLDLSCIPSSAALPQRTATGAACMLDGGAAVESGDSGGSDAARARD
jgi:hypothetical protein